MTLPATPPAHADSDGIACFPCSATQERCWFLDRLNPGNPALNVAIRWNVTGRFTAAGFEAAFRGVILRHEILRTRFAEQDGRPVQQVMETAAFHLSEIDIRTTPEGEQAKRVEAIASESAALPFDLTRAGAIRATLIRLNNDRAILAITVHQICFDGWSIGVLGREIGALAAAHDAGTTADLPDLPLQYGDYALWQQEYFASDAFGEDLAPWRKRLENLPYFELQPDFPRPLERSAACAMVTTDLPPAFGEALNREAAKRAMSPFAYGAGVLSAMLSRCADTPEVTIGTQVAGRTEVDLEPLIGVFINNVVLRFATPATTTLNDHLVHARAVVQEGLIGQNVPFNKLVEMVNPPRDPSRTPLISVNFILQQAFMETARHGGFELSSAPSHAPGAIYDLGFVLIGRAGGWRMTLEYNADLFDAQTAQDLLALWQATFRFAHDHADQCLSQMPGPRHRAEHRREDARQLQRIETALTDHPMVTEAAALPWSGTGGARRIHAFVAPAETVTVPLETLPGLLGEHLARTSGLACDGISVLLALPRDGAGRLVKSRLPLAGAVQATQGASPAAPMDTARTEARLAAIWADLLGVDSVAPDSDFFALGGHSLLTVRMLSRIESTFGQRLSLATAYRSPTLRALARHLAGGDTAPAVSDAGEGDWRVLELRPEGRGIPIIAINNARTVFAISGEFETPRPALAVRIYDKARGIILTPRPFEEIAADYVEAVKSARPRGPYALFGVCVHGNLAIEVARLLRAEGQEVAAVILKDVWEPRYGERVGADRRMALLNRLHFLRVRLRFLRRGDISVSAFLGTFRVFRNSGLLGWAVRVGLIDRVRHTDLDQEQEDFIAHLSEARNRHRPAPYDGDVLHFVTGESPSGRIFDPTMGWGRIVTGQLITTPLNDLSVAHPQNGGIAAAARAIEAMLLEREAREPEAQENA
ncbi:condensation domain-containing protein [Oceaniglobus trochenteri]|uniref:condensation domain-containing protein n=1 Tax=Oceaniglobus trochenteri TaxID=2763260 RepID=UPI001D000A10|nr:condensation domain-containing protein [Oceaniglobus trochenteri]